MLLYLFLVVYFFILITVFIYASHRYYMVYLYYRHKKDKPVLKRKLSKLPRVTIQLPIYNEMYVARRLITASCDIDYPTELLDIQVLDDSMDETTVVARKCVEELKE
ncbi:MAG TPA: glycosyl transferase family 2, partial [Nitrospirae bacterium]|nr:glycosyl transferase family 2 [Nitrospirota bacterium]